MANILSIEKQVVTIHALAEGNSIRSIGAMITAEYEQVLGKAFRDLHHCTARWLRTVPVVETWQGKTVWHGDVEVFDLVGHPQAKIGYAWAYDKAKGSEIVAVLELPPVISPKTAVQVAVVGQLRAQARN
jgi:hypothetical protein